MLPLPPGTLPDANQRSPLSETQVGFINWHRGEVLDVEEYEHYEQVENGDLNWIVPGKLMAFSGPSSQPKHFGGWRTYSKLGWAGCWQNPAENQAGDSSCWTARQPSRALGPTTSPLRPHWLPLTLPPRLPPAAVPEDYIHYFREKGVTSVVRLNKRMYEASRFTSHGVRHYEMYFPDGTCPSEPIMYRFLDTVEREPGALAVRAGRSGRRWGPRPQVPQCATAGLLALPPADAAGRFRCRA